MRITPQQKKMQHWSAMKRDFSKVSKLLGTHYPLAHCIFSLHFYFLRKLCWNSFKLAHRSNAKRNIGFRNAIQFWTQHTLIDSFTSWNTYATQRARDAKYVCNAITHWRHGTIARAFVGWINSLHYLNWKRKAMSSALMFLGNKPLHTSFSCWQSNVQKQKRNRILLKKTRQKLVAR